MVTPKRSLIAWTVRPARAKSHNGRQSTLAVEVARQLRAAGRSVALTDLDAVAEMALPTLPDWDWAHTVHAQLVGAWIRTEVDWVIDEGTSSPVEVNQVLDQVPDGIDVFHVVLTAEYDASLARSQSDLGRGISKDPELLRADHDEYSRRVAGLCCHLRLHVEDGGPAMLARRVVDHLWLRE